MSTRTLASDDIAGVERLADAARLSVVVVCDVAYDTVGAIGQAIRRAAPALRGHHLVVAATWRSIAPAAGLARAAMPAGMVHVGVRNWDLEQQERARRYAQECVAIAQECGVDASAHTRQVSGGWATSVAAIAQERGAGVIVLAHARRARRLARVLARGGAGAPAPLLLLAG